MIVVERDFIAKWVRELKQQQDSGNRDYYTGYMSAMSTVEGVLAIAQAYDLDRIRDMPHPGLYTPEEVWEKMVVHGQEDARFKLSETIMYSPSEVEKILKDELPREPFGE